MRGLDTNVLLRYLAADDPEQSPVARQLVASAEREGEILYINFVVLCELVWNLRGKRFGLAPAEIARVIEELLASPVIEVQGRDLVRAALRSFTTGRGDFADHLLGEVNRRAGCSETVTFDSALDGDEAFALLSDRYPPHNPPLLTLNEPPA